MCNLLYKMARKGQVGAPVNDTRQGMAPAQSKPIGLLYGNNTPAPGLVTTPTATGLETTEKKKGMFGNLFGGGGDGGGKGIMGKIGGIGGMMSMATDVLGGFAKGATQIQNTKDTTRSLVNQTKRMKRGY